MGASSKNFSPQFDKRSSRTKKTDRHACNEEDILDEDEDAAAGQPKVRKFLETRANPEFCGAHPAQHKVDGIFQVIGQDVESALDDASAPLDEGGDADEDEEEELTYNSQGKPIARLKAGGVDKR